MAYYVQFNPLKKGKKEGTLVSLTNLRFLKIQGIDLKSKKGKKMLARITKMAKQIPSLIVSPTGQLIKLQGWKAFVRRFTLKGKKNPSAKDLASVRSMQNSSAYKAFVLDSVKGFWSAWVGSWAKLSLKPGQKLQRTQMSSFMKINIKTPTSYKHHGARKGGLIELSLQRKFKRKDLLKATKNLIIAMTSTRPANSSWSRVSQFHVLLEMDEWPSSYLPIRSPSSCSKKATPCLFRSRGSPCKTRANGENATHLLLTSGCSLQAHTP